MKEYIDDIEIVRYWLFPSNSKKSIPRLLSWISFSMTVLIAYPYIKKKSFDFIIVQSPPLVLGISGLLLSRFSGSKMVLNVSDLWPLTAMELGAISEGLLYKSLKLIEKHLYSKSFICLGQSNEIISHMVSHGARKTFLFRNGVNPESFKQYLDRCNTNKFTIIYAGLLGVAQGIVDICRNINFKTLNVEFHIYGAGPEQMELEQFLALHPDRGVFFHGQVSKDEIPAILCKHSVALIPLIKYIYGAVPSKIYESMAAGLPILFLGDGEAKSIIEEFGIGWTFHPRDYESLKSNIQHISTDNNELRLKKQNCLEAANSVFNRAIQIKNLHLHLKTYLS